MPCPLAEIISALENIIAHTGEVFGASEIECGNYKTLDLFAAKAEAQKYLDILSQKEIDYKYF